MGTGVFEELPKNGGAEYRPKGKPRHVYDHDWLIKELGKVAPFGIYNLNNNVGYVNLGQSRDTAEFASESVARWWHFIDEENFPGCRKLFIVCDGGGSNGSRVRLWKWALACFAEFYGLEIHVSHLPPGTSKWKALRSFEWVSAWLSGIVPSGAPPPTPRRSPPRGSRERRALTPLLSPNHRLLALNHLVNLLSRHMLGLTACATPRQLDDSIPRENYPHESAKGQME